jgi:hypothetical protein
MADFREQELSLQLCIIAKMQKEERPDSRPNRQAAPGNEAQNEDQIWQRFQNFRKKICRRQASERIGVVATRERPCVRSMDLPAADLSPSYLPGLFSSSGGCECEMQPTSPSVMCSDPRAQVLPAPCPPLPAQTTRILTTEVVATSQMLPLGRMFREWFPEFDVRWLSTCNGVSIE